MFFRYFGRGLAVAILVAGWSATARAAESGPSPDWQRIWSPAVFEQAAKENKLVLLDMEAVWCHWCHVMDRVTYSQSQVISLIEKNYIPLKIDQDAQPDLSLRYRDWGWPATIILDAKGRELKKMRGFIDADRMEEVLERIAQFREPEVENESDYQPAKRGALLQGQKDLILGVYNDIYDSNNGGWGSFHRFIIGAPEEYALRRAAEGESKYAGMSRKTLAGAFNLIDPVWGGAYQYSDETDWLSPHYERIGQSQYEFMRIYSNAYSLFGEDAYKKSSEDIYRFLTGILMSPEGVFYTSQNADLDEKTPGKKYYALNDDQRRKLGMPRIDKAVYTQNNGWFIEAMAAHYGATGDAGVLATAVKAAEWLLANHRRADGGFIHGKKSAEGQFLGDNLAAARGLLALYQSTGEREWLIEASKTADYIVKTFTDKASAGFNASILEKDSPFKKAHKNLDENVALARFLNLLSHYSGKSSYKDAAVNAMRYLASEQLIEENRFEAGILLADEELKKSPLHIVVTGTKSDAAAKALFLEALRYPSTYKQIEWYDVAEGKPAGLSSQVKLSASEAVAAVICGKTDCSAPVTDPAALRRAVEDFGKKD